MPEKESTNGNAPQASNAASNQTTGAAQPQPPSPPAAQPLNNTRKRTPDEYTKNFDLNEISPLHTSSGSSNGSGGAVASKGSNASDKSDLNARNGALLPPVVLQMRAADAGVDAAGPTATVDATFLPGSKRNKFRGRYDELMGRLDLSERSRVPFAVLVALCAVLLIVVIVLVALWPRLPAYLRTPVCVERECLEASAQVGCVPPLTLLFKMRLICRPNNIINWVNTLHTFWVIHYSPVGCHTRTTISKNTTAHTFTQPSSSRAFPVRRVCVCNEAN